MTDDNPIPRPRATSRSFSPQQGTGSITIGDCSKDVIDAIQAALAGSQWISFDKDGQILLSDRLQPPPTPIEEPFYGEAWQHSNQCGGVASKHRFVDWGSPSTTWSSGSFILQHICGYSYTREKAIREAHRLQSYGFECLRSRRTGEGKFWELWFLPGIWAAQGDFRDALPDAPAMSDDRDAWESYHRKIINWLCRNVSFGSLDLCVQRAAAVID